MRVLTTSWVYYAQSRVNHWTHCARDLAGNLPLMHSKAAHKLRGRATVLPPWWLEELNQYWDELKRKSDWSMQQLAERLTDLVGRQLDGKSWPWDRKTVERFLRGENPTEELVDAFCRLFPGLINPTYVARSREEAEALRAVSRKFERKLEPDATLDRRSERRATLADARSTIEGLAESRGRRHGRTLDSKDDDQREVQRGKGRRGPAGLVRGRPPAS